MASTNVRATLAKYSQDQLVEALDETWRRQKDLTRAAARISEEIISRAVTVHVPDAATITLVEDHSHDSPHGHLKDIRDSAGTILISGMSDEWHDLPWSNEIDEYVYDMFMLAGSEFTHLGDLPEHTKGYRFHVSEGDK